jgi:hypothetical protein
MNNYSQFVRSVHPKDDALDIGAHQRHRSAVVRRCKIDLCSLCVDSADENATDYSEHARSAVVLEAT